MLLKNAKIFSDGLIHNGAILIKNGSIVKVIFDPKDEDWSKVIEQNKDKKEIDCQKRLILPGIIDIHSHLRDLGQSEKETFSTGTKAAAYSGITTAFNMPNTKPPAISAENVKKWMKAAQNNIFVDIGFIAGVPNDINEAEIRKILELGVIGFKIYPLNSLNNINWKNAINIGKILKISSTYQIPIFIHAAFPLSEDEKEAIINEFKMEKHTILKLHDLLNPIKMEGKYIEFIIENYKKYISDNKLDPKNYPIVHFCHVSCIDGYSIIQKTLKLDNQLKITFEITPHHLLLSNEIKLEQETYGKVLPPLRSAEDRLFLFNKLVEGNIPLIGTDHAPHTLQEKSQEYFDAPSGFPGFETYPLMLLHKTFKYKLPLENFVKVASENPARIFKLKNKGFIKEGYNADLIILEKVAESPIRSESFKTKAKFSPFEGSKSTVRIWKVLLKGHEINNEFVKSYGTIIKGSYKV